MNTLKQPGKVSCKSGLQGADMMIDQGIFRTIVLNFREFISGFSVAVLTKISQTQGGQFIDPLRAMGFGYGYDGYVLPAHLDQGPTDFFYGRPGAMLHLLTVAS